VTAGYVVNAATNGISKNSAPSAMDMENRHSAFSGSSYNCVCDPGYGGPNCKSTEAPCRARDDKQAPMNIETGKCVCSAHFSGDHCKNIESGYVANEFAPVRTIIRKGACLLFDQRRNMRASTFSASTITNITKVRKSTV
jgi:hypothetical protein